MQVQSTAIPESLPIEETNIVQQGPQEETLIAARPEESSNYW